MTERSGGTLGGPGGVAVIGMAGRFPGARTVDELWDLVRSGREAIRRLSDTELRAAGVPPDLLSRPNYVKAAAVLDEMEMFDAAFFGLSPRDAAIMDPQHRHFLECAWEALESAGYVPESFSGSIGVFGGCGMQAYFAYNLLGNPQLMASAGLFLVRHTGNDKDFLTTRVSYHFNLRGPSISVQTACSTSLVAVHLACQSLLNGECDMALAGGVTIEVPHRQGYLYEEGEILSPDGHCRAFDAESQGTVFGSGVGLVVLRRLDDALADGDHVHAVIRGSAINNDGSGKVGYLAPSVDGQAAVIAEAIAVSGVDPETITYVETHGTGTPVGDPIEIAALTEAFGRHTSRKRFCAIGSIKTNIGHLDTAAGVASLIKSIKAIEAAELPPSLHFTRPNPSIPFDETPFAVNATLRPWPFSDSPRRAGVSSLGVGGTNAYVVVEQAPAAASRPEAEVRNSLLLLSARSDGALEQASVRLARHLRRASDVRMTAVAYTLLAGRRGFSHRLAAVCSSAVEAASTLERREGRFVRRGRALSTAPPLTFMFPGGGAQHPGMAADLYALEPTFRDEVDRALASAKKHLPVDLRALLLSASGQPPTAAADLERPSVALPALFTIEYALAKLLLSWGLRPDSMIGHSLGEYVAACLSGVFSLDDGLYLVSQRGALFERLPDGAMVSVPLSADRLLPGLPAALSVAAVNGPELCVVSGPTGAVQQFADDCATQGVECQRLRIAVAAHSAMLEPILGQFLQVVRSIRLHTPEVPFISNVTGTWITNEQAANPQYWVDHLRRTVQFSSGLSTLLADESRCLIEVGPGTALSSIAKLQTATVASERLVATLGRADESSSAHASVLAAAGQLWVAGVALEADGMFAQQRPERMPLPTYPFEHQRHWIDATIQPSVSGVDSPRATGRDVASWLQVPVWERSAPHPADRERLRETDWLVFTAGDAIGPSVVRLLEGTARSVSVVELGQQFEKRQDGRYALNPASVSDYESLFEDLKARRAYPTHILYLWAAAQATSEEDSIASHLGATEQNAFYGLLHLAQALSAVGNDIPLQLGVITRGLQPVADEPLGDPAQALVLGPMRVVPRELPHVSCRAIDLPASDGAREAQDSDRLAQLAQDVVGEMVTGGHEQVVAFRNGSRWTQAFQSLAPAATLYPAPLKNGGVYLIAGGLGGIALTLAEQLARSAASAKASASLDEANGRSRAASLDEAEGRSRASARLVLVARSTPSADRLRRLDVLKELGAEVLVEQGDVADRSDMERVIGRVLDKFGTINGVVHTAGVLDDALIQLKQDDAAALVLRPKVRGTVELNRAVHGIPLDFWINCSSVSSLVGLSGQIDYAAANAFLDAFAHWKSRRDGTHTVSINWGAWRDVGMLANRPASGSAVDSPLLHRHRAEANADIFDAEFDVERDWFLNEHRLKNGEPLLPGTAFLEIAARAARHLFPDGAIELGDVIFLSPFLVPDRTRALRLSLDRQSGEFEISSRSTAAAREPANQHVRGVARCVDPGHMAAADIAAIKRRCPTVPPHPCPNVRHLRVGPRWGSEASVGLGQGEAYAALDLPTPFVPELGRYLIHPALLDLATSFGLWLAPGYEPESDFYVPLSYGRVLMSKPLPGQIFCHATWKQPDGAASDLAILDVRIYDRAGEPVCVVEHFVAKRLTELGLATAPAVQPLSGTVQESTDVTGIDLSSAIRPDEGAAAFLHVLGSLPIAQVTVSPSPVDKLRAAVDRDSLRDTGGSADRQQGRPRIATPLVEARDDLERRLAAIWSEMLGVSEVGIDDNFFELGGHSLLLAQVASRIRKALERPISIVKLFERATIREIADLCRSEGRAPAEPALVPVPRETLRVSWKALEEEEEDRAQDALQ